MRMCRRRSNLHQPPATERAQELSEHPGHGTSLSAALVLFRRLLKGIQEVSSQRRQNARQIVRVSLRSANILIGDWSRWIHNIHREQSNASWGLAAFSDRGSVSKCPSFSPTNKEVPVPVTFVSGENLVESGSGGRGLVQVLCASKKKQEPWDPIKPHGTSQNLMGPSKTPMEWVDPVDLHLSRSFLPLRRSASLIAGSALGSAKAGKTTNWDLRWLKEGCRTCGSLILLYLGWAGLLSRIKEKQGQSATWPVTNIKFESWA